MEASSLFNRCVARAKSDASKTVSDEISEVFSPTCASKLESWSVFVLMDDEFTDIATVLDWTRFCVEAMILFDVITCCWIVEID